MCGFICSISKTEAPFPQDTLRRMASMITHRGPDDSGFHSDGAWLSMAFRRLSILDLSPRGHQPMLSADGRHAIVFNGEIYNYKEIRAELESGGVPFKSDCDTEVILEAYRKWGEACLDKFIGMFAFAIADLQERSLFAARDPLGIKPLFLYQDAGFLILASEMKALLPYARLELDEASVNEYLIFRSLPGEQTMFKGVASLAPGSCLRIHGGRLSRRTYFSLAPTMKEDSSWTFEKACEATEEALKESVRLHLRSDVELGVQLSGGVDSSLITALSASVLNRDFHTFSISFGDSRLDESGYQKAVATRYNAIHHDYPMEQTGFVKLIPEAAWHYEHPLNDPNAVCTLHLVKEARKLITVMLSGEGADESFMGYTRFLPESVNRMALRNLIHRLGPIRESVERVWPFEKGRALLKVAKYPPVLFSLSYSDLNHTDMLLKGRQDFAAWRHAVSAAAGGSTLREIALQDQACDLAQWFWRADRIGMAASMELRVPFCTAKLFKLANSIPHSLKVRKGVRKAALKRVAEKYLDRELIYRRKVGFGTPVDEWMERKGPFLELFEDTVNSQSFKSRPFIDHAHFGWLYDAWKSKRYVERNSGFLWTYFNLELWHKIYFEGGWRDFANIQ